MVFEERISAPDIDKEDAAHSLRMKQYSAMWDLYLDKAVGRVYGLGPIAP